jgi:hypothetical protein
VFRIFFIEPQLTLCDPMSRAILRTRFQESQAESFGRTPPKPNHLHKRKVTELLPARRADAFPAFKPATSPRANGREGSSKHPMTETERLFFITADFF